MVFSLNSLFKTTSSVIQDLQNCPVFYSSILQSDLSPRHCSPRYHSLCPTAGAAPLSWPLPEPGQFSPIANSIPHSLEFTMSSLAPVLWSTLNSFSISTRAIDLRGPRPRPMTTALTHPVVPIDYVISDRSGSLDLFNSPGRLKGASTHTT